MTNGKIPDRVWLVQATVVRALRNAAKASSNGADIPTERFHGILNHFVYPLNTAEAQRAAATCPGVQPGTVNYEAFLSFVRDVPLLSAGRPTPDRVQDNLTTGLPWQVRLHVTLTCYIAQHAVLVSILWRAPDLSECDFDSGKVTLTIAHSSAWVLRGLYSASTNALPQTRRIFLKEFRMNLGVWFDEGTCQHMVLQAKTVQYRAFNVPSSKATGISSDGLVAGCTAQRRNDEHIVALLRSRFRTGAPALLKALQCAPVHWIA